MAPPTAEEPESHILLIVGDGSRRIRLGTGTSFTFGRSEEVDVRVDDASVSRRHARLELDERGGEIVDLESRNGVRVNGERIHERRRVVSGDVIALGEAIVVVYLHRHLTGPKGVLDAPSMLERLAIEIDRAARTERPLSILLLSLPAASGTALATLLGPALRPYDVVGFLPAGALLVVFPELDAGAAEVASARVTAALGSMAAVRLGIASCPVDGVDPASLIAAARDAAGGRSGSGAGRTFALGDRSVVIADPGMLQTYELVRRLATGGDQPVLLAGEPGVGKELAARALHAWSQRGRAPFVSVACAAASLESDLFGHGDQPGLFEDAAGGTLFLDEVAALPPEAQDKLVLALETGHITRVGDTAQIVIDIRLVAATNRRLDAEVEAGRLRGELHSRLAGAAVSLPPLRDRARDIPVLARAFLDAACAHLGRESLRLSDATLWRLAAHPFRDNVRELAEAMDYAAVVAGDPVVEPKHLPPGFAS